MDNNEKILALEKLITDDDFKQLRDLTKYVNIYKIIGMGNQEIKHSNTIAWFLDPLESHNLGSLFFQKIISHLFNEKPDYFNDKDINILELLLSDLDDAKVVREENNIDILFRSQKAKFILCIENKVWAGLSKDQLNNYREDIMERYDESYKKVFVFLSPFGYKVPDNKSRHPKDWIPLSYQIIVDILDSIPKLDIEQKIKYIIDDYINLLKKEHIVENPELDKLLGKLCGKHKDAIDILLSYSSNYKARIKNVYKLIIDEDFRISSQSNSNWLAFRTEKMNNIFPKNKDNSGFWEDGTKYIYGIGLEKAKPYIMFQIGSQGQDSKTIEMLKNVSNTQDITAEQPFVNIEFGELNIFWYTDEENIKNEIMKKLEEIDRWEDNVERILCN